MTQSQAFAAASAEDSAQNPGTRLDLETMLSYLAGLNILEDIHNVVLPDTPLLIQHLLIKLGDHDRAEERYHAALQNDPRSQVTRVMGIQIHLLKGEYEEAENILRGMSFPEKGLKKIIFDAAMDMLYDKRKPGKKQPVEAAQSTPGPGAETPKKNPGTKLDLELMLEYLENVLDAMHEEPVIEPNEEYADLLQLLKRHLRPNGSEQQLRRTLKLETLLYRQHLLLKLGRKDDALREYERALQIDPIKADPNTCLMGVQLELLEGRTENARKLFGGICTPALGLPKTIYDAVKGVFENTKPSDPSGKRSKFDDGPDWKDKDGGPPVPRPPRPGPDGQPSLVARQELPEPDAP